MSYKATIGLEIHAELKTETKMFCSSKNDPDAPSPNTNVCPVCMGHPGTLPVANKEAIRKVIQVGTAVGGTVADYTEFDRKNYFYPDLPKGYQISQYEYPLISGGSLSGVQITRIHLEEDTARSSHEGGSWSNVDFNRAGVPLMELVTDPVIHDAETAVRFASELQLLLRYLGAGEANMEKGQMRVEANISVSETEVLGTKVEVKNLNSFRSVERAIRYEVNRQIEELQAGRILVQETRGWDEVKEITFSQRAKESSHDYRYFPDPDIPKIKLSRLSEFSRQSIESSMPELPWAKRRRLIDLGLDARSAEVLVSDDDFSTAYNRSVEPIEDADERRLATNILLTNVRGLNLSRDELLEVSKALGVAARMRKAGEINSTAVQMVLEKLRDRGGTFDEMVRELGLGQQSDSSAIDIVVENLVKEHPKVVDEIKAGKLEALRFLVGQGMKLSKGAINPKLLEDALANRLKS